VGAILRFARPSSTMRAVVLAAAALLVLAAVASLASAQAGVWDQRGGSSPLYFINVEPIESFNNPQAVRLQEDLVLSEPVHVTEVELLGRVWGLNRDLAYWQSVNRKLFIDIHSAPCTGTTTGNVAHFAVPWNSLTIEVLNSIDEVLDPNQPSFVLKTYEVRMTHTLPTSLALPAGQYWCVRVRRARSPSSRPPPAPAPATRSPSSRPPPAPAPATRSPSSHPPPAARACTRTYATAPSRAPTSPPPTTPLTPAPTPTPRPLARRPPPAARRPRSRDSASRVGSRSAWRSRSTRTSSSAPSW
jgi:hypothetical protein